MDRLTGLKDTDREILKHVDDKELLKVCSLNRKFWNEVCDENFLRRRLLMKYPEIEKYKKEKETWRRFFLRAIHIISKMKEEFQFEYVQGDFDKTYNTLQLNPKIYYLFTQAVFDGDIDLVKYSLEKGADINKWGRTAIELAIHSGNLEMIKFLVDRGANIRSQNYKVLAISKGHIHILNYLLEKEK